MKEVFHTEITENIKLAEGVYSMTLNYPETAAGSIVPGQFINLYLNRRDLLLPRPISICRVEEGAMTVVYRIAGAGTKELAGYLPGASLRVSTPLGNGYDLSFFEADRETTLLASPAGATPEYGRARKPSPAKCGMGIPSSALLVGGGIGIPPLLELTYRLKTMGVAVDAVLGFQDEPFLLEAFQEAGARVHLATDSGRFGFRGTALELIKEEELEAEACFACGPGPMLRALSGYCADSGIELQVSMEERMGCGFGACVGCACKVKTAEGILQKKVCKDGPVFPGNEVVWDA